MFDLTGKKAWVTGSSRGIGRAIALTLAGAGAEVLFHGVTVSGPLQSAVQEAGSQSAGFVTGDMGDSTAIEAMFAEMKQRGFSPDILVLNSSVQTYMGVENFAAEEFERQIRTNYLSSLLLLQHAIPEMKARGWGRIIFVSSINQVRPAPRLAVYASIKSALANVVKSVAKEYAACGITANVIVPGVIDTDRNAAAFSNQEFVKKLTDDIPMHRFGTVQDCAPAVLFLASEEASYITGAEIPIAGGWQL